MGFFASFLMCHLYFRHRFTSTGYRIIDFMWRILLYLCFSSLAGAVAYSRYLFYVFHLVQCAHHRLNLARFYLAYHSLHQITWGFLIGVALGVSFYIIVELLPMRRPSSVFGRTRVWLMQNQLSTWLELRDGWSVWHDGGREEEWRNWRSKWELLNCKENERRKAK
jgi:dolichyldiphosphatase